MHGRVREVSLNRGRRGQPAIQHPAATDRGASAREPRPLSVRVNLYPQSLSSEPRGLTSCLMTGSYPPKPRSKTPGAILTPGCLVAVTFSIGGVPGAVETR